MKQPSWLLRWLASLECAKLRREIARIRRHNPSRWVGGEVLYYYNHKEIALMARLYWVERFTYDEESWAIHECTDPNWPERWPDVRQHLEEHAKCVLWDAHVNQTIEQAVEEWGIFKQPVEPFTAAELAEWNKAAMAARAAGARQRGAAGA